MITSLLHCYKKKILASIYCDPEDRQKHYTGYIESVNDSEILIAHITKNGYYDGYILRRVDDVYRIDYDGEYERRIEALYKARRQAHTALVIKDNNESLFLATLKFAKENDFVVSFIIDDDCRAGLIKRFDNDIVCLCSLNDNGEVDGATVIKTADILVVEIDTDYEQDLKLLHKEGQGDGLRKPY